MNFHPTKKSRHNKLKIFGVILACIILLYAIMPNILSGFFTTLLTPFWKVEQSVQMSGFFHSRSALFDENQQLKEKLAALETDAKTIEYLQNENVGLKALLGRPMPKNSILATVLSKPPFSSYDSIILDVGSVEGIAIGSLVYAPDILTQNATSTIAANSSASSSATTTESHIPKISIGKVTEVFAHTSRVSLYSSSGQKFAIEIGKNHIKAEATARGGGSFEVIIPRDADVHIGDAIVIPDIDTIIFGIVGTIVSDPARAYSTILFNEPINPFEIHNVLVQTQSKENTSVSQGGTTSIPPQNQSTKIKK
jgi:cell shape-determining protein MreC